MGSPEIQHSYYSYEKRVHFPGATPDAIVNILELTPEYLKSIRDSLVDRYGQLTFESFLQRLLWKSRDIISFEDFVEFPAIRNNFYLFFVDSFIGEIMRSQQFYIDFQVQNPHLDAKLKKQFASGNVFSHQYQSYLGDLYKAYRAMVQLDSVDSNRAILQ